MIRELQCTACGRLYIAVSAAAAPCRACGAALEEIELQRGIYELGERGERGEASAARRAPPPPSGPSGSMVPEDLGYGKSHGYGPSHGGPTGPGDAPAPGAEP